MMDCRRHKAHSKKPVPAINQGGLDLKSAGAD